MESVFFIITGAFLVLSLLSLVGLGFMASYILRLSESIKAMAEEVKKSNASLVDSLKETVEEVKKSNGVLVDELKQANTSIVEFLVKLADEVKKQNRTLKTIEQIMEDINEEEEAEAELKAQQTKIRQQRRSRGLPEEPGLVDVEQAGLSYDERYRPSQE